MYIAAQAMGVDADNAGFEKDGEEIMNLKVNGALALHFLCTENPYEHLTQLNWSLMACLEVNLAQVVDKM